MSRGTNVRTVEREVGAVASESGRGQGREVEGAARQKEAGVRRAERTLAWRDQKGRRGNSRLRAGEIGASWQGRAEARGRAGGVGCGDRRGERGV